MLPILTFAATILTLTPAAVLPVETQSAAAPVHSRTADEAAIKRLGYAWQDAWNKRDAAGLAALADPDLVFVSVLGPDTPGHGRGGREAFRAAHAQMLLTAFSDSRWTTREVNVVRWLRPDIAVAHVVWETTGDRVRHLAPGSPRRGIFTWVVEKKDGKWLVAASQNTEVIPPLATRRPTR